MLGSLVYKKVTPNDLWDGSYYLLKNRSSECLKDGKSLTEYFQGAWVNTCALKNERFELLLELAYDDSDKYYFLRTVESEIWKCLEADQEQKGEC